MKLKDLYGIFFLLLMISVQWFAVTDYINNKVISKTQITDTAEIYDSGLKSYKYQGEIPVIEAIKDDHKAVLLYSGWSEHENGYGIYFHTYSDPQIFINYLVKTFGVYQISDKSFPMPFPEIENWKFYQWENVPSLLDKEKIMNLSVDARSYFDGTEMYMAYNEFFIKPEKSEFIAENDAHGKLWLRKITEIIDSLYFHQPLFKDKEYTSDDHLFIQQTPINYYEVLSYVNLSRYRDYRQEIMEVRIDSLGHIKSHFLHYLLKQSGDYELADSFFLSKFVYPQITFVNKPVEYETLLFLEYNPYRTRFKLFLNKSSEMNLENDTIWDNAYKIIYRKEKKREFYYCQLGMDSMFVFEKTEIGFKTLFSIGHHFSFWNDYYSTHFELKDFNLDGWTDFLIRFGEPFNGSGSQFVSMYVFDSLNNRYISIPEFSEYDINEIIPYKRGKDKCLAVYTSGSNYGTNFKYRYTWNELSVSLQEYATMVVQEPETEEWYEQIEYYKRINGNIQKIWNKRVYSQDKAQDFYSSLIYPDSLVHDFY